MYVNIPKNKELRSVNLPKNCLIWRGKNYFKNNLLQ